jgi:hypothetical protein
MGNYFFTAETSKVVDNKGEKDYRVQFSDSAVFQTGGVRYAFSGYYKGGEKDGKKAVVKIFKDPARNVRNEIKNHLPDFSVTMVTEEIVDQFNKHTPNLSKR